jgi:hypothetical protein
MARPSARAGFARDPYAGPRTPNHEMFEAGNFHRSLDCAGMVDLALTVVGARLSERKEATNRAGLFERRL